MLQICFSQLLPSKNNYHPWKYHRDWWEFSKVARRWQAGWRAQDWRNNRATKCLMSQHPTEGHPDPMCPHLQSTSFLHLIKQESLWQYQVSRAPPARAITSPTDKWSRESQCTQTSFFIRGFRTRKREEKGKLRRNREEEQEPRKERMSRKTKKSREDFQASLSTFKIKL